MAQTLGARVAEALERADMTVKDLERALERAGVEGGSYANLHRLKSDKLSRPSAELVHGIARATDVDAGWLVTGEGEATPEEERRARAEEAATAGAELLEDVERGVAEGFGPGADRLLEESVRLVLVLATWRRLVTSAAGEALFEAGEGEDVPRRIGEALRAPFEALDLDPTALPDARLTDYTSAACHALRRLATPAPPSPSIRDGSEEA